MNQDVYSRLCHHFNNFPLWAPEKEAFIEILKIMFSPEEAELALFLTPVPVPVSEIAGDTGKDETTLREMLEILVKKGSIFKKTEAVNGKVVELYGLLPSAPGLWETTFAKKEKTPRLVQLAKLWRKYLKTGWQEEMHKIKTPPMRVVPVENSIDAESEVLPYERASDLLKTSDFFSLCDCACRTASELAGDGCGKPTDVCLLFGDFGKYLVEQKRAKEIDLREALEVLERTEKEGLVHLTMNSRDTVVGICSCCSCCCTQLGAISQLSKPTAVAKSRYKVLVSSDECTACGICEERCQVEAISVIDDCAEVEEERCIGCGLCVTTCPAEAIALVKKDDAEEPPETIQHLTEAIIREKDSEMVKQKTAYTPFPGGK